MPVSRTDEEVDTWGVDADTRADVDVDTWGVDVNVRRRNRYPDTRDVHGRWDHTVMWVVIYMMTVMHVPAPQPAGFGSRWPRQGHRGQCYGGQEKPLH